MSFHAHEVAKEVVKSVAPVIELVARRDADLAKQMRRAATSIPLNIAEGRERVGRDRLQHFRIALGSSAEVGAALAGWKSRNPFDTARTVWLLLL